MVNNREIWQEVYVIDNISMELILGVDFVARAGLIINGKTRKVIMGDQVINETFDGGEDGNNINMIGMENGRLMRKIEIPGHTICCTKVTGPQTEDRDYISTDYENGRPDILTYHTITRKSQDRNGYRIMIGNSGSQPIILDKGTKLVNLEAITTEFKPPKLEELGISAIKPDKLDRKDAAEFLKKINLKCPTEYREKYN